MSTVEASPDMGVTGNAVLLLGYIGGAIEGDGSAYRLIDVDVGAGAQTIENAANGNTYRITVVQLTGRE